MANSLLARLADRLVLCPTRHEIPPGDKTERRIAFGAGDLQIWTHRVGPSERAPPDLFILKFPGTGGRAECATAHPADRWPEINAEIWAVNPPGYGGSSGRASLRHVAAMADAAFDAVQAEATGRPILVTGNSLGCVAALYLAAHRRVSGLLLRNPPPLRQLIVERHGWWNLGLGARLIARQIPAELCPIANAARAAAPALFIMSRQDRVVPVDFQQRIHAAYAGENRVMPLANADHGCPPDESELPNYVEKLVWLLARMRSHAACFPQGS